MNDIIVIPTDNKRYIKINEYEAFLAKENSNNFIKSIKYEERLIKYNKDYKGFDLYRN